MASPSTVITLGYGTFGSVNLVPTLGYGSSAVIAVGGPYFFQAAAWFAAGADEGSIYAAGAEKGSWFGSGAEEGQIATQ